MCCGFFTSSLVVTVKVADLNFVYVVARILEFLNPELNRASL